MAQITGGPHRGHAAGDTDIEKAASQLVADIKYKVNKEIKARGGASHLNPAQVAQKYAQKLAASPAPGAVKAIAKKKLMGTPAPIRKEEFINGAELATESVVNALYKVFVEKKEVSIEEQTEYLKELYSKVNKTGERLYHIIVTDKKTGNTYTRDATREKIAELRANPNIASVEMSERQLDSEKEKNKGENTAKVKAGKGLDPVGKEDADLNNNGIENDKSDKYLKHRRDVRGAAIAKEEVEYIEERDEGNPGLMFTKIAATAAERYGSQEAGNRVAGAIRKKVLAKEETEVAENPATKEEKEKIKKMQTLHRLMKAAKAKSHSSDIAKEEFIADAVSAGKDQNDRQIKPMPKGQKNNVVIAPAPKNLMAHNELEGEQLDEKITANTDMGAAIEDFEKSSSKQLAGRTKEQRRQAAIAAVLTARRGGKKLGEEAGCGMDEKPKLKKSEGEEDPRSIPTKVNLIKNKLRAMGARNPIVMSTEETVDESHKDAMSIVMKGIVKQHGAKAIVNSAANKRAQAAQPKPEKPKRKLPGYSIPGAPKEKSYND